MKVGLEMVIKMDRGNYIIEVGKNLESYKFTMKENLEMGDGMR